ncbi:NTP/NDP exchange transporter [Acidobacteriota bacterium]
MKKFDVSETSLFFRFLRLFTKIEACEIPVTLLLTINIFFLLVAYYIIKPVRDALILTGMGPEVRTYLAGGQVILLIFIVKIYVRLACKIPRHKLIARTTLFFMSNLLIFYALALMNVPMETLGILFFIWVGIFNLLVVAQFWAFANDIYTQDEGKRLFPIIAFGATFGAFAGSKIAGWLMAPLGVYQMLLFAGGILGLCVLLSLFIHQIEIKKSWTKVVEISSYCAIEDLIHSQPLKKGGAFNLVFKKQYLLYIAILIFILNLVNTNGEYILAKVVTHSASELFGGSSSGGLEMTQWIGKFYADFYLAVSLASMLIQLFLVSRIFKWIGIRGALLVLPIIAFSGYLFISLGASLLLVKWVKIMENGTDYSLMNTARHALFLFTSREAKYKAMATIGTFFWRSGDVTSALIVFLGTTYFTFNVESFALFNVIMVGIWIVFSFLVIKEQKKLTPDALPLAEKA